jgi:amino acid adenylation domain-containing protein
MTDGLATGQIRDYGSKTIEACLAHSFESLPDKIAVHYGREVLTYREIDLAVSSLVARLAALGIGRGDRVGLHLQRSPKLLIAMLATGRVGAAYVPLDPRFPQERLEYMARDAGLPLIVTDSGEGETTQWPEYQVLDLSSLVEVTTTLPVVSGNLERGVRPSDIAYVIYTSGTTGRPKGVAIPQVAVANFLQSMLERPGLGVGQRLVAVTTASFDISVLELLLPLAAGATVVIADSAQARNGAALKTLIEATDATAMQATASTWRILIDAGWRGAPYFKALIGGEALNTALADELLDRCGEVWNMYGPTETTVWSSCWKIERPVIERVSLGEPIANTGIEILDDEFRRCPVETPGEIFISGLGLADGYWNQPEQTASRFVVIDSGPELFRRKFRTGDLAQWRRDGSIQYLGRKDDQIKLRGYRIEPAEIESRLAAHPSIVQAAVTLNKFGTDDHRIVAFVVPASSTPDAKTLRAFLGEWLPPYMIPQHYVVIDALPLLPNGKVNRRELSARRIDGRSPQTSRLPDTPLERRIAGIWMAVLAIDGLGADDNFADLGGQSLFAAQIAARIQQETGLPCQMVEVLNHPTVATLTAALVSAQPLDRSAVVTLQGGGALEPIFCIGGIHLYQELADEFLRQRPVIGMYVNPARETGYRDPAETRVNAMAHVYAEEIRRIQPRGPYHIVGFSFGGVIAHAIAIELMDAGEAIDLLCLLDSDAPGRARPRLRLWVRRNLRRLLQPGPGKRMAEVKPLQQTSARAIDEDLATASPQDGGLISERTLRRWMREHRPAFYRGAVTFVEALRENLDASAGWERLADDVAIHHLESDHLGLLKSPQAAVVATIIREALQSRLITPGVIQRAAEAQ